MKGYNGIIHSCCRQQSMEVGGQETWLTRAARSSTSKNLASPPMHTVFIKRRSMGVSDNGSQNDGLLSHTATVWIAWLWLHSCHCGFILSSWGFFFSSLEFAISHVFFFCPFGLKSFTSWCLLCDAPCWHGLTCAIVRDVLTSSLKGGREWWFGGGFGSKIRKGAELELQFSRM